MIGGFGESGSTQSRNYAWQACIICRAPIRISLFLVLMFLFQWASVTQGGFRLVPFLSVCGQQAILMITVLCHEFGHGTATRLFGGDIDHILLWPFGGICFSTRSRAAQEPKLALREELAIVAAGPGTHFLMAPIWAAALYCFGHAMTSRCIPQQCTTCSGTECIWQFLNPLGTLPGVYSGPDGPWMGGAAALVWTLLGIGVRINAALFMFNVFFPMYPADGSKLLTLGLIQCCGTSVRTAATVLLTCTSLCAAALLLYAIDTFKHSSRGENDAMMCSIMGFMGVMSIVEACRLQELRSSGQLHQHPTFSMAVEAENQRYTGVQQQASGDNAGDASDTICCLCCCNIWSWRSLASTCCGHEESRFSSEEEVGAPDLTDRDPVLRQAQIDQRQQFLGRLDGNERPRA
eukprot:TRINITY_DN105648_c0_g1_i1.p1 TRINITY_DN105648_c0_g1~~TRINITY_DN105648_c0_g1_i1.p1  ORF type:complete len:406 (-),score=30.23 TRINITY_DN105648_c0_g1_i1:35-1252(-)